MQNSQTISTWSNSYGCDIAADEICERIHKTGVKVVRVMASSKQQNPSPVKELCCHVLAMEKIMAEDKEKAEKIQLAVRRSVPKWMVCHK